MANETRFRIALTILLLALFGIFVKNVLADEKPIVVVVHPYVLAGPSGRTTVQVGWRILRHPDNRAYSFIMVGANGDYTSSEGSLEGDRDRISFPICTKENSRPCYRDVRRGTYSLEACVYRPNKTPICDRAKLEVK